MDIFSVTLNQKSTSLLTGGLFLLMALICGAIACFDGQSVSIAVTVLCVLCSGLFFFRAGNQQTLDAEGIHIKNYFSEYHYPWDLVQKVKIIRTSYRDMAHIQFFIRGYKKTVLVYYTKRALECVCRYYGEPDEVCIKEPPVDI